MSTMMVVNEENRREEIVEERKINDININIVCDNNNINNNNDDDVDINVYIFICLFGLKVYIAMSPPTMYLECEEKIYLINQRCNNTFEFK